MLFLITKTLHPIPVAVLGMYPLPYLGQHSAVAGTDKAGDARQGFAVRYPAGQRGHTVYPIPLRQLLHISGKRMERRNLQQMLHRIERQISPVDLFHYYPVFLRFAMKHPYFSPHIGHTVPHYSGR